MSCQHLQRTKKGQRAECDPSCGLTQGSSSSVCSLHRALSKGNPVLVLLRQLGELCYCRGSTLRHPHIFSEYCSPFSNSSMKTEIVIWMNDGTDELHPLLKSWPSISSLNAFSSGFQSLDEFYDIYQDWADGEVSPSLQDRLDVASAPRAGSQGGVGSQLGLDGLKGLFQLQLFCDPVNWTMVPRLLCSALGSPTVTAAPSWFPSLSSCAHFPPENIDLSLCMFSSTWALLVSIPGQSLFSEHPQKHVPLRALISNGVLQNRCS